MTGCKLITSEVVQGGWNKIGKKSSSAIPLSILDQTDWACRFFDFSKTGLKIEPGRDIFNCSIAESPTGDWLAARVSEHRHDMIYGMNRVVAYRLDGLTPVEAVPVNCLPKFNGEHFEDPRIFWHGDRMWLSVCNFVWAPRYSGAHQALFELDAKWNVVKRHDVEVYGNGSDCYKNSRNEKNWLWFFHEGMPHLIYLSQPLTIAAFDEKFNYQREYKSPLVGWGHGEIRGGTPPVLVGDEYVSFFHSSNAFPARGGAMYHMVAYTFDAFPPFRLKRITAFPLLSGSPYDRNGQGKPVVVFPCGAIYRFGMWTVSFGVNDLESAYIRIPHEQLLEKLTTLKR